MDSPFIIPLAVFAMVVLLVSITGMAKLRDIEVDVRQKLLVEEMDHRHKMEQLDLELRQLKKD